MKRISTVAFHLALGSAIAVAVLAAPKPSSPDVQFTIMFDDAGALVGSDGQGIYEDGHRAVQARLSSSGLLSFTTCASGGPSKKNQVTCERFLYMDFTDQIEPPPSGGVSYGLPLFQPGLNKGSIAVNVVAEDGEPLDGGLLAMMNYPGEMRFARLKLNFRTVGEETDGTEILYTIRFKPTAPEQNSSNSSAGHPDSSWARVTYLGGSLDCATECAAWEVKAVDSVTEPIDNPECCPPLLDTNDDGARDTVVSTEIGTLVTSDTDEGDYRLPFRFVATALPPAPPDDGGGRPGGGGRKK